MTDREDLLALAKTVGDDWKSGPYYDQAEQARDVEWQGIVWPFIEDCDFSGVVHLAAGHGRNSEKLRHLAKKIYVVDINEENIEFLRGVSRRPGTWCSFAMKGSLWRVSRARK